MSIDNENGFGTMSELILGREYGPKPMAMLQAARSALGSHGDNRPIKFIDNRTRPAADRVRTRGGIRVTDPRAILIWLDPSDEAADYTLAHEIAHLLLWIESPTLQLNPDRPPPGSAERVVLGTLLSTMEHPEAHAYLDEFDVDWSAERDAKVARMLAEVQSINRVSSDPTFYNMAIGVTESNLLAPADPRLSKIESELRQRSPSTARAANQLGRVLTQETLKSRDWPAIFKNVVTAWSISTDLARCVYSWEEFQREFSAR